MLSDDYTMPVIRNVNPDDEETSLLYMESIMDEALFGKPVETVSIIIYKAFLFRYIVKYRVPWLSR